MSDETVEDLLENSKYEQAFSRSYKTYRETSDEFYLRKAIQAAASGQITNKKFRSYLISLAREETISEELIIAIASYFATNSQYEHLEEELAYELPDFIDKVEETRPFDTETTILLEKYYLRKITRSKTTQKRNEYIESLLDVFAQSRVGDDQYANILQMKKFLWQYFYQDKEENMLSFARESASKVDNKARMKLKILNYCEKSNSEEIAVRDLKIEENTPKVLKKILRDYNGKETYDGTYSGFVKCAESDEEYLQVITAIIADSLGVPLLPNLKSNGLEVNNSGPGIGKIHHQEKSLVLPHDTKNLEKPQEIIVNGISPFYSKKIKISMSKNDVREVKNITNHIDSGDNSFNMINSDNNQIENISFEGSADKEEVLEFLRKEGILEEIQEGSIDDEDDLKDKLRSLKKKATDQTTRTLVQGAILNAPKVLEIATSLA